jgi:hypothetical protein
MMDSRIAGASSGAVVASMAGLVRSFASVYTDSHSVSLGGEEAEEGVAITDSHSEIHPSFNLSSPFYGCCFLSPSRFTHAKHNNIRHGPPGIQPVTLGALPLAMRTFHAEVIKLGI